MSSETNPELSTGTGRLRTLSVEHLLCGRDDVREVGSDTTVVSGFIPNSDGDPLLSIVVDLLPIAVLVLDLRRVPQFANPAADRLLQKGDIFHLAAHGDLKLTDRTQREPFETFVASLLGDRSAIGYAQTARFFVRRADQAPVSISGATCRRIDKQSSVVLFIRVPDTESGLPTVSLQAMFGLTRTEADLANALVAGESLAEFCKRRQVSINTGKTQLKAVLAKTGTRRQVQLVRKLAL